MRAQRNLFEDNPLKTDGDPANSSFWDGTNKNMFSEKKYPHKGMLYSLEMPHSYDPNASFTKSNQ